MNHERLDSILEKSFRTEPGYRLSDGFAQKVTSRIVAKNQWLTDIYEYFYLSVLVLFLIGIAAGTYYLVNKEVLLQIFKFISGNAWQVAMIALILNFIFFADRVLLRLLFRSLPQPYQRRGERVEIL
jgi:hypothetical protein